MLLGATSYICVFVPHRLGIVHTYVPDSSVIDGKELGSALFLWSSLLWLDDLAVFYNKISGYININIFSPTILFSLWQLCVCVFVFNSGVKFPQKARPSSEMEDYFPESVVWEMLIYGLHSFLSFLRVHFLYSGQNYNFGYMSNVVLISYYCKTF